MLLREICALPAGESFAVTGADQAFNEAGWARDAEDVRMHTAQIENLRSEAEQRKAFLTAYTQLASRLNMFIHLPLASLDKMALQKSLSGIGADPHS